MYDYDQILNKIRQAQDTLLRQQAEINVPRGQIMYFSIFIGTLALLLGCLLSLIMGVYGGI